MRQAQKASGQRGFTIIELMIATLVFSTVLLLCATGLIAIGRMYQKGNTSRVTQEAARSTLDTIKNDFELSGGSYKAFDFRSGPNDVNAFCIGDNLYAYQLNSQIGHDGSGHALVAGPSSADCASAGPGVAFGKTLDQVSTAGGRELLGPGMQLAVLGLTPFPNATAATSLNIKLTVAFGDNDLLGAGGTCKGGAGQEWCASSTLETYATKRLQ